MRHVRVKVFPGFKTEHIEQLAPDRFKIYLREIAENNAANKRLLAVLSVELAVPENKLRIISGHKHQNKIIEILE